MSYHQRPHELRLAISSEAEALISNFGGEAHAEACRRAAEASSDSLRERLELCRRDDRPQIGSTLICARRPVICNVKTLRLQWVSRIAKDSVRAAPFYAPRGGLALRYSA